MPLFGQTLKNSFCCLIVLFLLLLPGSLLAASTHVPVGSWIYPALEKLEAEGLLATGILTSRPITRAEAARLVKEAESGQPSVAAFRVIQKLKKEFAPDEAASSTYFRPFEEARFKYLYADGTPHFLNLNNKGDIIGNGSNFRAGLSSSAGAGPIAFYLNPEIRYPEGPATEDAEVVLVEGYGSLTLWNIELTAGRQSLWWGPGFHGALLLSDNARPFDLIKLTNPKPLTLPWIFRHIGPVKLTGFVTRLEEDRDFANPYLAGLRLDLKPHSNINIGIARVAMFGGAGRHVDAGVIWDVITAGNENVAGEPGNQLGSIDLKIVLPFKFQKVVVYGELGGEDEAGSLPSRVAYIAGAYLPGVLGIERLDLRVEYGQTYIGNHPGVWYQHHVYTNGYTYDGRIIGHHMGTDARDLFISAVYESAYGDFEALFDIESSGRAVKSKNRSAAITWSRNLSEVTELSFGYYFDRQTNIDGVIGQDLDAHSVMGSLGLSF
ncbi:MAG TPA: capsule assembly Wzi family protein [Syntrophales bacterium]|nr:capsule assembly Wzi family protein [Syntrophales bacterium]